MINNQVKQEIADSFKLLNDSMASVRVESVKKLGAIGIPHPQIIERLQSMALNDPSSDVRTEANRSLGILQPAPMRNEIQENVSQQHPEGLSHENDKAIIDLLRKQNETLENLRALILQSTEAKNPQFYQLRTRIVDIDMSISSMVNLMLKWVIASIPAGIIIGFFLFILSSCIAILGN